MVTYYARLTLFNGADTTFSHYPLDAILEKIKVHGTNFESIIIMDTRVPNRDLQEEILRGITRW